MFLYVSGLVLVLCHFSCIVLSNAILLTNPLGMESGDIEDTQLLASTQTNGHPATEGRLNGGKAWRPEEMDSHPWIQVTFTDFVMVHGLATQGRKDGKNDVEYVTTYRIEYSDGETSQNITSENDTLKVFAGNTDRDTPVYQPFSSPVKLKMISIHPLTFFGRYALRFELYASKVILPTNHLGMESGDIEDSQISASTERNNEQATDGRLNGDNAWKPDKDDSSPWIQVTFANFVFVNGIATQGRNDEKNDEYVTEYKIEYSDGETSQYIMDVNGTAKVFDGNVDRNTPVFQAVSPPVKLNWVKIYPTAFEGDYALRFELYGSEAPSTVTSTMTRSTAATTTPSVTSANLLTNTPNVPSIITDRDMPSTSGFLDNTSAPPKEKQTKGNAAGAVGAAVSVVVAVTIVIIAVIWLFYRRKTVKSRNNTGKEYDGPYELTIEGTNGPIHAKPNHPEITSKPQTAEDTYEDTDENSYAYADVKDESKKAEGGLVHIYAQSQYGGRPPVGVNENKKGTDEIYHDIQDKPNEYTYVDLCVKTDAPAHEPKPEEIASKHASHTQEGWEDNVIYATENPGEGPSKAGGETKEGWKDNSIYYATDNGNDTDKNKEGWEDNSIYAATDDADQNGTNSQNEGWEDNVIYALDNN